MMRGAYAVADAVMMPVAADSVGLLPPAVRVAVGRPICVWVQRIERLGAEVQLDVLRQAEAAPHRQVDIPVRRNGLVVATLVAEGAEGLGAKAQGLNQ